jgi:hypothetical protein
MYVMSDLFNEIGIFLFSLILVSIGILSIKHYYDVRKSGEAIAIGRHQPARYGEGMPVYLLKGKYAIKNANNYLVSGIFCLLVGLPFFVLIIYSWVTS